MSTFKRADIIATACHLTKFMEIIKIRHKLQKYLSEGALIVATELRILSLLLRGSTLFNYNV
jgi:hypothetical protein